MLELFDSRFKIHFIVLHGRRFGSGFHSCCVKKHSTYIKATENEEHIQEHKNPRKTCPDIKQTTGCDPFTDDMIQVTTC